MPFVETIQLPQGVSNGSLIFAHMYLQENTVEEPEHYYTEYRADAQIKEPWNTFSSLFFFIPVVFWGLRLRSKFGEYPILTAILPLFFLNGVGSTMWHARGGSLFGLLDVLPPLIMMLILCAYFWRICIGKWGWSILIMVGFLSTNIAVMTWAFRSGSSWGVNLYYILMALMISIPLIWVLIKTQGQGWKQIVLAVLFLIGALTFRVLDEYNPFPETLPQGTHFLWHLVSVGAVFPLGHFLIFLRKWQNDTSKNTTQ